MDLEINDGLAADLSSLYANDDAFRKIAAWFYERRKDSWEMPVRIAAKRTDLSEREVRRVFKALEQYGCGRFIKGRGDSESRMAWKLSIRSIAAAAKGETSSLEEIDTSPENTLEAEEAASAVAAKTTHTFKLRADFDVTITLPVDFTEGEAERLSLFLKAVPII